MAGAVSCSHGRAHQYFIESIDSPCPFTAYPCTSADEFHVGHCLQCHDNGCSQMGYNADKFTARGSLFLETEGSSAYCGELCDKSADCLSIEDCQSVCTKINDKIFFSLSMTP